jgi:hypothetical protein
MKLRFEAGERLKTITADRAAFTKEQLVMLADRLYGIDVCQLSNSGDGTTKFFDENSNPVHIVAEKHTVAGLVAALEDDDREVAANRRRHRNLALSRADSGSDIWRSAKPMKGPKAAKKTARH